MPLKYFHKTSLIFTLIAFLCSAMAVAQPVMHPVANPKAVVVAGNARFTILTPRLIRLEWTASLPFTDKASFTVINRDLPVPVFTNKTVQGTLIIKTAEMELHYKTGSGKFTAQNLSITSVNKQHAYSWQPGVKQTGNLKGTYRTLDNFDGDYHIWEKRKMELEDGLLATDGWTLIDDTDRLLFDGSDWPWVTPRPEQEHQDYYFFGYGHQYKKALNDYMQVAGRVPLPPRYAFGYWWSRYWSYSDNEIRDVVQNFEQHQIPLDVFVVDMDWHYTDSMRAKNDVFDQPKGWTGWTWNRRLFPDPDRFLTWMKQKDLKVTLNLHPASGIAAFEQPYGAAANYLHFDTTGHANIPYVGSDKKFMNALFSTVLHPMEKKGVSFWWLDWQQWPNDRKVKNLNNTWWLNYVFFTDMERTSASRPLLYHRWGGLGNHRYQLGFSGDAVISWKSLAFQPYFTASASNVLYGYWSHDIGGHQFGPGSDQKLDPELYVRWMQYGALSPIFRTHSSKNANLNKEVWNFGGEYYDALKNAIELRYQLNPYIYTMARKTYETGISLCRPLYYDYPDSKEAYDNTSEYMFGDNLLVAPVTSPMVNGQAQINVWLPGGTDWFEWQTGTMLKGGQTVQRSFALTEYPVYVKAGAIIPGYPHVNNLTRQPGQTYVDVFPGANGTTSIYEDAGNSKNYAAEYATTRISSTHLQGRKQQVTIMPRQGAYPGMPAARQYTLRLVGAEMPQTVIANGKALPYADGPKPGTWTYNGKNLTAEITLPNAPCSKKQQIDIQYSTTDNLNINTGLVKQFRLLSKNITALKFKDADIILPEIAGRCEETNLRLQYYPADFYKTLRYFIANYPQIPKALSTATKPNNVDWFEQMMSIKPSATDQ